MSPQLMSKFVVGNVKQICEIIDDVLVDENQDEILGASLMEKSAGRLNPKTIVKLSLLNDCLCVAETAVAADGRITEEETEQVYPLAWTAARFYARTKPSVYNSYLELDKEQTIRFLRMHHDDQTPFGGSSRETAWLGLDICHRVAQTARDTAALDLYEEIMLRLMETIIALGEITPQEEKERDRLKEIIGLRRRMEACAVEVAEEDDARIVGFCSPDGPEVFHATAHASQIWEKDPFDVETIHAEARLMFERTLDRVAAMEGDSYGRVLLILGDAGSGKTHLMRAFRDHVHQHRAGYVGYLQMSSGTANYARYVLGKLIDSLEHPYDAPEVTESGLICLSNAVAETSGRVSKEELLRLQDAMLTPADLGVFVSQLADRILSNPRFAKFDVDVLRAFLYLQRRDPPIRARVVKYLRCENLNPYDQQILGDMAPRTNEEDPLRMLTQIGQLVSCTDQGSLVLLVDQLEDVFNLSEPVSRFRRAMDVVRHIGDEVPSSVIVISCLGDFYTNQKPHLTRAVLDRIERDPDPCRLTEHRSGEEIEALVARRLRNLYEKMGIHYRAEEPTFPFAKERLDALTNLRTRDVLDWCRTYQESCMKEGQLTEPPEAERTPTPRQTTPEVEIEQLWNDHQTNTVEVPDEDDALSEVLARSVLGAVEELANKPTITAEAEGRLLRATVAGQRLLVAICNKGPQGGGLSKQITEAEQEAKGRTTVLVRCSEYPSNPRTHVAQKLGELLAKGGRRVVCEDGDWRTMLALRDFREKHEDHAGFATWLKRSRPLTSRSSIRTILGLDVEPPRQPKTDEAPKPKPKVQKPEPEGRAVPLPEPEPKPAALKSDGILIGKTRGLRPDDVEIEPKTLTMHAAFLGSTGSGKTTLALNIIEQLVLREVPVLLVDRKGDLCSYALPAFWQKKLPDAQLQQRKEQLRERLDIQVYTPGAPDGRPLPIPVVPANMSELPSHERTKVARYAASGLGAMMDYRGNQNDISRLVILGKAIEILSGEEEVSIEHVIELIDEQDPTLINAIGRLDTKLFRKLVDHLETLRHNAGDLIGSGPDRLDTEQLLGLGPHRKPGKTRLSIISTKFLGENTNVEFWVSRLLVEIARWASKHPSKALQAVMLFDEADIYLPALRKPATKEPMQDLLKRARSAGLSVLLATQSPGDLDYRCRDNIRTWFVGRVAEKTAVDKMKPLLSDCRTNISGKLANAAIGEFYQLASGTVTSIAADRSVMDTEQLPENEILELARKHQ